MYVDVYISQGGVIIANHSYLNINDDIHIECSSNYIPTKDETYTGDWFSPNGSSVGSYNDSNNEGLGTWRSKNPTTIHLRRKSISTNPPEGLFYCEIQDRATRVQKLYVGLYSSGRGHDD